MILDGFYEMEFMKWWLENLIKFELNQFGCLEISEIDKFFT